MAGVSPFFQKTAWIRYTLGEIPYTATGTLYEYQGSSYLVTSRHVFRHEHEISPDSIRLYLRTVDDPTQPDVRDIEILSGDESVWKTHNSYSDVDLAVLDLGIDMDEYGNTPFVSSDLEDQDTHLELAGASVNAVGYPGVLGGNRTNKPIVRNGLVASPYGEFFRESPCFVMEANMQDGMSGSPVVLKPNVQYPDSEGHLFRPDVGQDPTTEASRFYSGEDDSEEIDYDGENQSFQPNSRQLGYPTRLIGIHSGPVEQDNRLNLHRVWYPNLINEIIEEGDYERFGDQ